MRPRGKEKLRHKVLPSADSQPLGDGHVAGAHDGQGQGKGEGKVGPDVQVLAISTHLPGDALPVGDAQEVKPPYGGVQHWKVGVGGAGEPGGEQQVAAVPLDPLGGSGERVQGDQVSRRCFGEGLK